VQQTRNGQNLRSSGVLTHFRLFEMVLDSDFARLKSKSAWPLSKLSPKEPFRRVRSVKGFDDKAGRSQFRGRLGSGGDDVLEWRFCRQLLKTSDEAEPLVIDRYAEIGFSGAVVHEEGRHDRVALDAHERRCQVESDGLQRLHSHSPHLYVGLNPEPRE